ncbi:hypothetical protein GYN24_00425 [Lactococcus piscium]|uniref:Uncharacterized protein n=1 Tax=Pseudolactococcus paracarnosus TaxID=2749962 RepID=A0A7L4WCG8_9LACT|nr:hypothetical protein [Lactococcus paracarnosus]MCJ1993056.1 hypothetical protein [Lactococcus paracarnosus]QDJ27221.1 hypothetical protein BHS01_00910 [Lactococcus paracarnosus]SPC37813.1 conserved hypothetical protein [Lactococcus piscium]
MKLIRELIKRVVIKDNDVYALSVSKQFIIINNNYSGLLIYDLKLNFIKKIEISKELMIYELYSSKIDDKIVIFDGEHQKLYILDLYLESNIVSIDRDEIFLNYFKSCKNSFMLRDNKFEYQFSFTKGNEISCKPYKYQHVLFMNNTQILIEEKRELYLLQEDEKTRIKREYHDDWFYVISDDYIIEYDEKFIKIVPKTLDEMCISSKSGWTFREVLLNDGILTILINSKADAKESQILQYKIK